MVSRGYVVEGPSVVVSPLAILELREETRSRDSDDVLC